MESFILFFKGIFCQTFGFDELEDILQDYKNPDWEHDRLGLVTDLLTIIHTKSYKEACKIMAKEGSKSFDVEQGEKFIKFLHDRLLEIPTEVKATDFSGKKIDESDLLEVVNNLRLPTDALTWFFMIYFNQMDNYKRLDEAIESFKHAESEKHTLELIYELEKIIESNKYKKFLKRLKVHSHKKISTDKAKKLALFLYNRLTDTPTDIKPIDFKGMRK